MEPADALRRGTRFRELHQQPTILVLPNPWDAGTARLFERLGFAGLATTSAGLAFSLGRRDGDGAVNADETFAHCAQLLAATSLPISADLENGFGEAPEVVARTIARAGAIGLSGASIEDATYRPADPILCRTLAVERISAAVEAARALSQPFVLTARCESFIRGRPDLDDTLWRLAAYERAGADVLYAPGLPDEAALRQVCASVRKPVNYVAGIGRAPFSLAALADIGVRRVTIGTSLVRCALGAALAGAREILERGTFDYALGAPSVGELNQLIDPR
jgi:2-methylisocitrate lyase-like PEP mutase family enzyme